MGLILSLKPKKLKLLLHRGAKKGEKAVPQPGPVSGSSNPSSPALSLLCEAAARASAATNAPEPQTPASTENRPSTTDSCFSEILNSQAGSDYTSYCNSGYEDWDSAQVPRNVNWEPPHVPTRQSTHGPRRARWGITDVPKEDIETEPENSDSEYLDEVHEEPEEEETPSRFAGLITSFEKEALKKEITKLRESRKHGSAEPKRTSKYQKRKKSKNNVSRGIFSQLAQHFLGVPALTENATTSTEELDEHNLNKTYSKVRFNTIVDVNFIDNTMAPSHLLPIDYAYQASLRTDVHQSKLYTAEEEVNALKEALLNGPPPTKNPKKRVLSDSYNSSYQANRKRVCTPHSIAKSQTPKPLLTGTKKWNPKYDSDQIRSNRAVALSYNKFEENLEQHRQKKMHGSERKHYKYELIAQHYSDLKTNGYA